MTLNLSKAIAVAGVSCLLLLSFGPSSRAQTDSTSASESNSPTVQGRNPDNGTAADDRVDWRLSPNSTQVTRSDSPFVESAPKTVAPFPIVLNRAVQEHVSQILEQPMGFRLAMDRSRPFMPEMMKSLLDRGVPSDLVYLTFAESGFTKRGKGPWQFTPATARRYGLRVDRNIDERRDPVLSTKAAADYLSDLHDAAEQDWRVAIIGWNMGEGNLDRYWLLRGDSYNKFESKLPRRTRQLLDRLMAAAYVAQNAVAYGLESVSATSAPVYRTVVAKGGTALSALAHEFGTTVGRIHDLNPALLTDKVPSSVGSYKIRVPLHSDIRS